MMNSFSALQEYDLENRLHQRDLYQTSAFCGHVFTMKLLLKNKNTWRHDRKQMWLPDAHLCYLILTATRPCVAVLLHGATTSSAISPQMHPQNPADAPPESRGTTRIRRTPTESCLHLQRAIAARIYVVQVQVVKSVKTKGVFENKPKYANQIQIFHLVDFHPRGMLFSCNHTKNYWPKSMRVSNVATSQDVLLDSDHIGSQIDQYLINIKHCSI